MPSRVLQHAGGRPASVIVQQTPGPVVCDSWPDGEDLLCRCGRLLASCVHAEQLWDIAIECGSCGEVSACGALPAGQPLPSLAIVLRGEERVDEPIDLRGQTLIGVAAFVQREAEIGARGTTFGQRTNQLNETLDPDHLRGLVEVAKEILGEDLERLARSSRLSRTSHTPSRSVHGLVRAIELVEESVRSFLGSEPLVDVQAWAELRALATLTGRWRGHPEFESLRHGLIHEYEHTLILLTAATFLEDYGNGISLHAPRPGERTPDLRLGARHYEEALVEIKTPMALRWPEAPLSGEEANRIVRKAVKKASTGRSGQLRQGVPGLLVIGGLHLSMPDLDLLKRAAEAHLAAAARLQVHRSLMGILFATVSGVVWVMEDGRPGARRQFDVRVSQHPGYSGVAELRVRAP